MQRSKQIDNQPTSYSTSVSLWIVKCEVDERKVKSIVPDKQKSEYRQKTKIVAHFGDFEQTRL